MPTKFIAFLGTNPYLECSYYFTDPKAEFYPTRFVQVSLIRHLALSGELNEESEIFILVTGEAKERNWKDGTDREGQPLEGLETQLSRLKAELEKQSKRLPPFRLIDIPEGKSEEELWAIFNIIAEKIQDGDHLFFDITHSFRSLPMLALVVLNYLRVVKNVTIEKIYYGAFETLGPIPQVKETELEARNAFIFDLTPFVDLLQWTTAADHFLRTGNTLLMTELTHRKTQPLLQMSKGQDRAAVTLHKLGKTLSKFTKDLMTIAGPELPYDVYQVKAHLENARIHANEIPPLANLLDKILTEFSQTETPQHVVENTNLLVEFCFKHGLIQQGFTLLDENLITYGCLRFGLDYQQPKHRKLFTSALEIKDKRIPENKWRLQNGWDNEDQKLFIRKIVSSDVEPLIKLRSKIAPKRNALNHASFNVTGTTYENYLQEGSQLVQEFKNLVKKSGS
ncbi:MAG: hypothetical protein Kow0042_20780 [Calditrichia bacterium]